MKCVVCVDRKALLGDCMCDPCRAAWWRCGGYGTNRDAIAWAARRARRYERKRARGK